MLGLNEEDRLVDEIGGGGFGGDSYIARIREEVVGKLLDGGRHGR